MPKPDVTKPDLKIKPPRDVLRDLARDMAATLERQMEDGNIERTRVLALLDRWACAEHLIDSGDAALRVRLHRLIGTLETDFITARIAIDAPDARALLTVGMARDWMAGAFREAIVQVRSHFPDVFTQRVGDAYAHVH